MNEFEYSFTFWREAYHILLCYGYIGYGVMMIMDICGTGHSICRNDLS